MNDRYFRALGWVGLALAVTVDAAERAVAWTKRRCSPIRKAHR